MSAPQHHITLYSHVAGPHGWKIIYVLRELGLDYENPHPDTTKNEHQTAEYKKLNQMGRLPTLVDHKNGDFVVWESNAIVMYLVDMYDKEKKLSVENDKDRHLLLQWMFLQASSQGPTFGQASAGFYPTEATITPPKQQADVRRLLGVLESVLVEREWLVGGKVTVADVSFVSALGFILGKSFDFEKEFPAVYKWHNNTCQLPGVQFGIKEQARLLGH
ncbi:Glutathione S-transferase 2 [Steccherinum ochraceum]|uniref:Glutathione S-transferase 2 n=1 Tax=Steccherinum ochraceum TaxID=92696 RepID=A0A4R0RD47_9APHY|nr:Glutathione S-transferase 2 [Steccherinum ochraceum]